MIVCGPEHLDEPVACAVHRSPLEGILSPPRKDDDDLRTVVFAQSRGQRIDDASGREILVLQIDDVACCRNGGEVERLYFPHFTAIPQFRHRARDSDIDIAQSRFQFAGPGGVP